VGNVKMGARIEANRTQAGISLAFAVVSRYKIFLNSVSMNSKFTLITTSVKCWQEELLESSKTP
jgi:hypothetical protein